MSLPFLLALKIVPKVCYTLGTYVRHGHIKDAEQEYQIHESAMTQGTQRIPDPLSDDICELLTSCRYNMNPNNTDAFFYTPRIINYIILYLIPVATILRVSFDSSL